MISIRQPPLAAKIGAQGSRFCVAHPPPSYNRNVRRTRAAAFVFLAFSASAQWINYPTAAVPRTPDGKPNLLAPAPRTPDGKPDFSGMWEMEANRPCPKEGCADQRASNEFINIGSSLKDGLPLRPAAVELLKGRVAEKRDNDPLAHCLPVGPVRLHTFTGFKKIVQAPGLVALIYEYNASYRQIMTDGRPLPTDPNPSWNGYSSGKWEGDTLVVETTGFVDGVWLDISGTPSSDALRIMERFRRPNFGNLEIELTVDDPKTYTKPWTVTLKQTIKLDSDLLDYICLENERDLKHLVVK
jgi:hypothetical protein